MVAPLIPEEVWVIAQGGTERPFSGKYWDHHEVGLYRCRRCLAPLFPSSGKFNSGTGWPSFDEAFPSAIAEVPDRDGKRTEIRCASCGAHLGHVFRGERLTPKDTRYCVNSVSLSFDPGSGLQKAYFAGGCFWGVEYWLERLPGVTQAVSGYMGGTVDHPTYQQVCTGTTGHVETVEVTYDPSQISYEALAITFFNIHDPTQPDGQGPDRGPQYLSKIFSTHEAQERVARWLIGCLQARGLKVVTTVHPATRFWPAESYHQDYFQTRGMVPTCHGYVDRFRP